MATFPRHATAIGLMTLDLTPSPPHRSTTPFANELIVGAGLLTHNFDTDGQLRLNLRSCVSKAWASDGAILDWLEDELALGEPLIGYRLRDRLIPLLMSKAAHNDFPTVNELPLVTGHQSFDLAEWSGDDVAMPLASACAAEGIPFPTWAWHHGQSGWLPELKKALSERVAVHAVATWRLWAEHHGKALDTTGLLAKQLPAIDAWLAKSACHNRG